MCKKFFERFSYVETWLVIFYLLTAAFFIGTLVIGLSEAPSSPDNYPGAIVIDKGENPMEPKLQLKIYENDKYTYRWILVPEYEYKRYRVGDTIK